VYFKMWVDDKEWILEIMHSNMAADIAAGYNPSGDIIRREREEIAAYKSAYHADLDKIAAMTEAAAERWCRIDMIKRGVITA